jgi:hypothetical protein
VTERIVNFANRENQLIDWNEGKHFFTVGFLESPIGIKYDHATSIQHDLEKLLAQLNLLLEKYPNALKEETMLKKTKALVEYAKKNGFTLSNCYSYFHEETKDNALFRDVKKTVYGIRTLADIEGNKNIVITGYASTASGVIYDKDQLSLKLENNTIGYSEMVQWDPSGVFYSEEEVLSYVKPNILTKHL